MLYAPPPAAPSTKSAHLAPRARSGECALTHVLTQTLNVWLLMNGPAKKKVRAQLSGSVNTLLSICSRSIVRDTIVCRSVDDDDGTANVIGVVVANNTTPSFMGL